MTFGINDDLRKIALDNGLEKVERMTTEEVGELLQALNKHWRKSQGENVIGETKDLKNHIAEEIADVEICLSQLKILLKCDAEVSDWKRYKVQRRKTK